MEELICLRKNLWTSKHLYLKISLWFVAKILFIINISDKYIIKLEILSKKPLFDTVVSDKISVQLLSTSSELSSRKKVIKKCEKNGLYEAMDIAEAWLCKALEEQA